MRPSRKRPRVFEEKVGGFDRAFYGVFYRAFEEKARGLRGEGRGSSPNSTEVRLSSFIIICLYLYLNFFEGHTPKGVGLRVADSHTGNHREDDFMPPETFEGFPSAFGMLQEGLLAIRRLPHRLQAIVKAATSLAGCYKGCCEGCSKTLWLMRRMPYRLQAVVKVVTKLHGLCGGCHIGCHRGCRLLQRLPHRLKADTNATIEVAGFYKGCHI
ncbi:hypothetical protein Tco_1241460, partial [Tanacetum coccineum]